MPTKKYHTCAHLTWMRDSYDDECLFLTVLRQRVWPQKETLICPRVLCFFSPVNCHHWDTAAAVSPRTWRLLHSLCTTNRSRNGWGSAFQNSSKCCSASLLPFLLPPAAQHILKRMFRRFHPKLTLVKVVATHSGMSKMTYKGVHTVCVFI